MFNEAVPRVKEFPVGETTATWHHPFQAHVGAETVKTEQQAVLQVLAAQDFPGAQALERASEAHPEIGFLVRLRLRRPSGPPKSS